jgi:GT2 family glycosyltransferase
VTACSVVVQIVTWNSAAVIDACLASLQAQDVPAFELIVVDNASSDDTRQRVRAAFARGLPGRLIESSRNEGFCGGQNRAFAASCAPWVLFLNPDATLPADFLARVADHVATLDQDVGTIAPLILLADGRIDSSGLFLDRLRRVYDRGQGERPLATLREEDVFGCTGAVALHRRTMLEDVAEDGKPLDERLFAYYDDLDLSWRAQLQGWRCRFIPALVATHGRAGKNALRATERGPGRAFEQRLALRNRLLVLAKCERAIDLLRALPLWLPYETGRFAYALLRAPASLPGYLDALRLLPSVWRSRRWLYARARPARLIAAPFHPWRARGLP